MAIKRLPPPKKKKPSEEKKELAYESGYDNRPTISFDETQLPQINDWTIDGEYDIVVKVQMTGISKMEYGVNKGKNSASFRIIGVGVEEKE